MASNGKQDEVLRPKARGRGNLLTKLQHHQVPEASSHETSTQSSAAPTFQQAAQQSQSRPADELAAFQHMRIGQGDRGSKGRGGSIEPDRSKVMPTAAPELKYSQGSALPSIRAVSSTSSISPRVLQTLQACPVAPRKLPESYSRSAKTDVQAVEKDEKKLPVVVTPASSVEKKSSPPSTALSDTSGASTHKNLPPPIVMKGSSGNQVNMTCNYVKVSWEPEKGVFVYDVTFNPDVDSISFRRDLLKQFVDVLGMTRAFDGHLLTVPFKLPQNMVVMTGQLPSDGSDVEVTIKFKQERQLWERVPLLNSLLRRAMNSLGLALIGRNFFDPKSGKPIPSQRLEVWPGYVTSIDEFEGGIFLCCDASHRVLRTQTMLDLLSDMQSTLGPDAVKHFKDLATGKSVLTRYNNRVYRVDDVDFEKNPLHTFTTPKGDISYVDYYHKSYGLEIKNVTQPLLVSRRKLKFKGPDMDSIVYLIPEFCYITGLTDEMRSDMKIMKDVATFTRILPGQRLLTLEKFIKNVNSHPEAHLLFKAWGIKIHDATVGLPGRVLAPETIYFGGNREAAGTMQADWSRASCNNQVLSVVHLENWAVVYPRREEKTVNDFLQMCLKCGPPLGIDVANPTHYPLSSDALDQYINTVRRLMTPQVQMVMCILSAPRADKYSAIKRLCCLEIPVSSQVILIRTIRRFDRVRAVAQKVLLQVNCKLGGTLWSVRIPVKNAMICGIDTYHDPNRDRKSVVALVTSMNPTFTRWYSGVAFQDSGLELGHDLLSNFTMSISKHAEVCGGLPDPIIIFRDGVSDGELQHCREVEFTSLFEACQLIDPDYKPKILFVVVQKRINTRLFLEKDTGVENPPPGSIMDHTITRRNWYDFFLVSQCVRQGTVNPTHYVVVQNSTSMPPDHVQRLSYKLTHLYYNWAGTVRVPAPCQYAHKLAYLVGESIHREVNEKLRDKLYYL